MATRVSLNGDSRELFLPVLADEVMEKAGRVWNVRERAEIGGCCFHRCKGSTGRGENAMGSIPYLETTFNCEGL